MKVSLIIITYNDILSLKLVLNSIRQQSMLPYEVIIADDGSTHETRAMLEEEEKTFPCILKHVWHEDIGFRIAKIRNKGIMASVGDVLIFSDGDLILQRHYVRDFCNALKPNYALIGTRAFLSGAYTQKLKQTIQKNEVIKIKTCIFNIEKNYLNTIRIPHVYKLFKIYNQPNKKLHGGLLAVWKIVLLEVRGFDEQFEGWGREDSDLLIRLINSGIKVRKLKHCALTLHLKHSINSLNRLQYNEKLLDETIVEKRIFPKIGLEI